MRLKDKTAIITGGAQGFGAGLAACLAAEGCNCVIADLNLELAMQTAEKIGGFAVRCDVTKEKDVADLCDAAMKKYGRLDMFISNAGILISGPVDTLTTEQFDLVTRVNYTAFYLCVKEASRVMRAQREQFPERTFDIIQINSKSGLEGSNKNFAYAGSKFGAIGLVQSFALELVEYGIKVNAICPGNYYEGPLWSDPERGLFAQYLKSGKAPGAKTVEDVRRFYEAKTPIRRGCLPSDVAVAVMYCAEQQYETGQAIPVTGGQVMLS